MTPSFSQDQLASVAKKFFGDSNSISTRKARLLLKAYRERGLVGNQILAAVTHLKANPSLSGFIQPERKIKGHVNRTS